MKKIIHGGYDISQDFINNAYKFVNIMLEDNYNNDVFIYGHTVDEVAYRCVTNAMLDILFNGLDKRYILNKNDLTDSINYINNFIVMLNKTIAKKDNKITKIDTEIKGSDENPKITIEQKEQVLSLIENEKFIEITKSLPPSPELSEEIKSQHIAKIKNFQEWFEMEAAGESDPQQYEDQQQQWEIQQ
jgi:hypothetical protein